MRREYKEYRGDKAGLAGPINKSNLLKQFLKLSLPTNIHPIYIIHASQPCIHTSMLSINLIKLINLIISDHLIFKQRFDFDRVKHVLRISTQSTNSRIKLNYVIKSNLICIQF